MVALEYRRLEIRECVVAASVVCVAWLGYWLLGSALLDQCRSSCSNATQYFERDPFCLIDPTCVSPLYRPYDPTPQHWVGSEASRLSAGQEPSTGWQSFAITNYVLFLLLMGGAITVAQRRLRNPHARKTAVAAILMWCALEAMSWSLAIVSASRSSDRGLMTGAFAVLLTTMSLLYAVARVTRVGATP
jgi:hypothetical protein